jgi:hypothetical protein
MTVDTYGSRADDPSPFGWIFGGLLAALGIGALVSGLLRRKGTRADHVDQAKAQRRTQV